MKLSEVMKLSFKKRFITQSFPTQCALMASGGWSDAEHLLVDQAAGFGFQLTNLFIPMLKKVFFFKQ